MDTSFSAPNHLHDAGVLTASELTGFSRAEALFVLDYARIIVELFFDENGLPARQSSSPTARGKIDAFVEGGR